MGDLLNDASTNAIRAEDAVHKLGVAFPVQRSSPVSPRRWDHVSFLPHQTSRTGQLWEARWGYTRGQNPRM